MYNNIIKRSIQKILFNKIQNTKGFLGLAEFNEDFESYRELIDNSDIKLPHKFINKFRARQYYSNNNMEEYFFENPIINISEQIPSQVTDCDFCNTILNSGKDLITIYNSMNEVYPDETKYLLYTFSLRPVSLRDTLQFFNDNLFDNTFIFETESKLLLKHLNKKYIKEIQHLQFKFKESYMYSYRNNTTPMLTGMIVW